MRYFPIFLGLRGRRVLVVGGSTAAALKVRLLRKAGAQVVLVAPNLTTELDQAAGAGAIEWVAREFEPGDVAGAFIVIAATGLNRVDTLAADAANAVGIPVNAVDRPELSSFIVPAIVDRSPLVIGISSGGTAPVLASRVRARIESLLPAALGRLAAFAEDFRGSVKANIPDAGLRRRLWQSVFDGPIAAAVLSGDEPRARENMLSLINRKSEQPGRQGMVYIVGAGPGDPDLLTLKALNAMQAADVVIHDRLVGAEILDYARRDAERIYVGKRPGKHTLSQDGINRLMAARAEAGQIVVRLKGGDPFIFGRGGEELEFLRNAGIATQVVPGITAASGCAAAIGMPLTHRDMAAGVIFITGHGKNGEDPQHDWAALARSGFTLVVYMGVAAADGIASRLIAGGLDPATPAAVIENGTLSGQIVIRATVAELGSAIADGGITGPALLIIGDVAALATAQHANGFASTPTAPQALAS